MCAANFNRPDSRPPPPFSTALNTHASISGNNPFALHLEGCVILSAANGDELWVTITGELNFFTWEITATVTYVGGEGHFEEASGSANLLGPRPIAYRVPRSKLTKFLRYRPV